MLALLYDIHGNLEALDAVLADASEAGARRHFIGGDVAAFGAWPAETVALLRELDSAVWIRGNWERWVSHPGEAPGGEPIQGAIKAVYEALGDDLVRQFGELPESAVLTEGTRAWHGSPKGDMQSFYPEPLDDEADLLEGVTEQRLVFGHTHLPFARTAVTGTIELVNPGSTGLPLDGDQRAGYALLHDDGTIEHRRVEYDFERSAAVLLERNPGAEWAEITARRVLQAKMDV